MTYHRHHSVRTCPRASGYPVPVPNGWSGTNAQWRRHSNAQSVGIYIKRLPKSFRVGALRNTNLDGIKTTFTPKWIGVATQIRNMSGIIQDGPNRSGRPLIPNSQKHTQWYPRHGQKHQREAYGFHFACVFLVFGDRRME